MSKISSEQEQLCILMGQVDALSKAMMAVFAANPELSQVKEALKSDSLQLEHRADQSPSDIAYAKGFATVYESIEMGSATMQLIADVHVAKKSGSIQ